MAKKDEGEKAKINYGVDEADWDNLMKAMKENRLITINHYWPNKRALALRGHKPRTYKVEPYQILCDDKDWYLWGLQKGEGKDRDRFRLYHFKKLDTVKITREKFTLPAKYKYLDVHSKECWWDDIWGIMPDERITMRFLVSADFKSKIDEDFIKRTRAFKSEEKPDGSLEVSFRLTPRPVGCTYNYDRTRSFYFPKEVWGDNVTPLEPKELVEAWGKSEPKIRVITQIT